MNTKIIEMSIGEYKAQSASGRLPANIESAKIVLTMKQPTIDLKLTPEQAKTLHEVLSHVGGNPKYSARKHSSLILLALDCQYNQFKNAKVDLNFVQYPDRKGIFFQENE